MDNTDFPALLAEIAGVIGRDAALQIAAARGGRPANFPSSKRVGNRWSRWSGGARHRGSRLQIPMAFGSLRTAKIEAAAERGVSVAQTARLAGRSCPHCLAASRTQTS
jgi:hypothetical protein